MFLFISTGTYFKLLDLEISGDLEILEMIWDDICIYMFMYIYVCVYVYIYGYNSFYSQRVSLAPLHPEMFTNIYIWGQAIFSHKIIFWIREESLSLGFSFDIKCLLLKAKFVHRNTLSIWQPLDSSCAESSSLWKFCDVIVSMEMWWYTFCILYQVPVWAEKFKWEELYLSVVFFFCELLECFKMGNLNCCSGGRFLLILWRLFLQMGWLTFTEAFSSSFFFF